MNRSSLGHRLIAVKGLILAVGLSACTSGIPNKFVKQAEPGVTLTALTKNLEAYRGKTVILGGVIVEQKEEGGYIWLKIKNRPLDTDHIPRIPMSRNDSESGHYWVIVTRQGLPPSHKNWARLTVVGRVTGEQPPQATTGEPVLAALYLQGWDSRWGGYGQQDTYESDHSIPAIPQGPKRY